MPYAEARRAVVQVEFTRIEDADLEDAEVDGPEQAESDSHRAGADLAALDDGRSALDDAERGA